MRLCMEFLRIDDMFPVMAGDKYGIRFWIEDAPLDVIWVEYKIDPNTPDTRSIRYNIDDRNWSSVYYTDRDGDIIARAQSTNKWLPGRQGFFTVTGESIVHALSIRYANKPDAPHEAIARLRENWTKHLEDRHK